MDKKRFNEQEIDNEQVNDVKTSCEEGCGQTNGDGGADNVSEGVTEPTDNSATLAAEAAEWKDKYLRLSAEFDNYRKRTLREKMELVQTGGEDVVKAMLNVLDDLERAVKAMETAEDVVAVREGVVLIAQKFRDTLKSKNVHEIEAMDLALDTDFHEAVAKIPVDEAHKGKIVDVVQKGYKLGDKVIRHAKVVVGD